MLRAARRHPASEYMQGAGLIFIGEPGVPPCLFRHPASGYVQGINDLVTPFLAVFLSGHFQGPVEQWGDVELPEQARGALLLCTALNAIWMHQQAVPWELFLRQSGLCKEPQVYIQV